MTQMTFKQACEALHDLDTHGDVWTRQILTEASRPETSRSELVQLTRYAADFCREIDRFRNVIEDPCEARKRPLLNCASRALAYADVIRKCLQSGAEKSDDPSWYLHEINALSRLEKSRAEMGDLPSLEGIPDKVASFLRVDATLRKMNLCAFIRFQAAGGDASYVVGSMDKGGYFPPDIAHRIFPMIYDMLDAGLPGWRDHKETDGYFKMAGDSTIEIYAVEAETGKITDGKISLESLANSEAPEKQAQKCFGVPEATGSQGMIGRLSREYILGLGDPQP